MNGRCPALQAPDLGLRMKSLMTRVPLARPVELTINELG